MNLPAESLDVRIADKIGEICFSSEKANSLSKSLLSQLAQTVDKLTSESSVRVILLKSAGEAAFCAGASFEEFKRISTLAQSEEFFMGFARVILAMRRSTKLVVTRVQGKAVGGGLGLIAAADYAAAATQSKGRLSEFELGIGPFTIGPAVERKIGISAFSAMTLDCAWREADWLHDRGLYSALAASAASLDQQVLEVVKKFAGASPAATRELKLIIWRGTEDWEQLLPERARTSGRLLFETISGPAKDSVRIS